MAWRRAGHLPEGGGARPLLTWAGPHPSARLGWGSRSSSVGARAPPPGRRPGRPGALVAYSCRVGARRVGRARTSWRQRGQPGGGPAGMRAGWLRRPTAVATASDDRAPGPWARTDSCAAVTPMRRAGRAAPAAEHCSSGGLVAAGAICLVWKQAAQQFSKTYLSFSEHPVEICEETARFKSPSPHITSPPRDIPTCENEVIGERSIFHVSLIATLTPFSPEAGCDIAARPAKKTLAVDHQVITVMNFERNKKNFFFAFKG